MISFRRVFCYETIQTNYKHLVRDLKSDKDLTRGDYDYSVSNDEIVVYKRMDNKTVNIVSDFHGTGNDQFKEYKRIFSKNVWLPKIYFGL